MASTIDVIEQKVKELQTQYQSFQDNVAKISNDMEVYGNTKKSLLDNMNQLSGAIQAYNGTLELLKGPKTPVTVDAVPISDSSTSTEGVSG